MGRSAQSATDAKARGSTPVPIDEEIEAMVAAAKRRVWERHAAERSAILEVIAAPADRPSAADSPLVAWLQSVKLQVKALGKHADHGTALLENFEAQVEATQKMLEMRHEWRRQLLHEVIRTEGGFELAQLSEDRDSKRRLPAKLQARSSTLHEELSADRDSEQRLAADQQTRPDDSRQDRGPDQRLAAKPQAEPQEESQAEPHDESQKEPRSEPREESQAEPHDEPQKEPREEPREEPNGEPRGPREEQERLPAKLQAGPLTLHEELVADRDSEQRLAAEQQTRPGDSWQDRDPDQRLAAKPQAEPQEGSQAEPYDESQKEPREEPQEESQAEPQKEPREEPQEESQAEPHDEPQKEPREEPQEEPRGQSRRPREEQDQVLDQRLAEKPRTEPKRRWQGRSLDRRGAEKPHAEPKRRWQEDKDLLAESSAGTEKPPGVRDGSPCGIAESEEVPPPVFPDCNFSVENPCCKAAPLDCPTFDGLRLWKAALRAGNAKDVEKVLQGITPAVANSWVANSEPAIVWAVRRGLQEIAKVLSASEKVDVNMQDTHMRTALHYACDHKHPCFVELLLARRCVDVNALDITGRSPLHIAAFHGHMSVVALLIKRRGLDTDLIDNSGDRPKDVAAKMGHIYLADVLACTPTCLQQWTNAVRSRRKNILTTELQNVSAGVASHWPIVGCNDPALVWALKHGLLDIFRVLLASDKVDVNATTGDHGDTVLHRACHKLHDAAFATNLLAHPCIDVDARDSRGRTPLHLAVIYDRPDVVALLMEHPDLDVFALDRQGKSALKVAKALNRLSIAEILHSGPGPGGPGGARILEAQSTVASSDCGSEPSRPACARPQ